MQGGTKWKNGSFLTRSPNSAITRSPVPTAASLASISWAGLSAAKRTDCRATPMSATAPASPKLNPIWSAATTWLPARMSAAASALKWRASNPSRFFNLLEELGEQALLGTLCDSCHNATLVLSAKLSRLRQEYLSGDGFLPALHKTFAYAGYWLNDPPGMNGNPWAGKRAALRNA